MSELDHMRRQIATLEAMQARRQQTNEDLLTYQPLIIRMIDIANEAIIAIDDTQRIVIFNQGAERVFGYSPDEVAGQLIEMLIPESFVTAHRRHIADFAEAGVTTRMMGERQEIMGLRKNGQKFPAEASISKFEVGDRRFFTVVLRDITSRRHVEQEREKRIVELKALNEATRTITSELSLEQVLREIVEAVRALIKVKYAALGVHDGHGTLSQFVTTGLAPVEEAKIGSLPTGRSLLGLFLHQGQSGIIKEIATHPASVGFPEHHPILHSLLGVSIVSKEKVIGALYLADKMDGSEFTETDQQLTEMLAHHAAIAIENARLYKQTQRLAVLEERERFARDLHDGIIQSTYGVGLSLDSAKAVISEDNHIAIEMIDLSLKSLAQVITDIRNYIFDLRPQALKDKGLYARLQGLIQELKINTVLTIEIEIDPKVDTYVNDIQASHIYHITHEALANVARHAKAKKIKLNLSRKQDMLTLEVEDDGVGFKPTQTVRHGHRGLANIQERAEALNAELDIRSRPNQGTHLTLKVRILQPIQKGLV